MDLDEHLVYTVLMVHLVPYRSFYRAPVTAYNPSAALEYLSACVYTVLYMDMTVAWWCVTHWSKNVLAVRRLC